jgi:transposase
MTISDVARHLRMSWHTIKEIDRAYLGKRYGKMRLCDLQYLAIDEIAYKKGHKYKTIVYDLEGRKAVYVGEGRSIESLAPFLQRLKSSGARIKAIATDMWPPYWGSVEEHLPETEVVFDVFHIVKQLSKTIDEIRSSVYKQQKDKSQRKLIKGSRWLLLKNERNLRVEPGYGGKSEKQRLEELMELNTPLSKAYLLKEQIRDIWERDIGIREANHRLNAWIEDARSMGMKAMDKFCKQLERHRKGILNWHKSQISTGPLEGFNNKIKVMKRSAYGFTDDQYFNLRILALHEYRYALLR